MSGLRRTNDPAGVIEPAPAWSELAGLTPARIALGRSGVSLPTRELLGFGLAHARARDAVHAALDAPALRAELEADGWSVIEVASAAGNRAAYLARPDWGRRLDEASAARVAVCGIEAPDLVLVLSDGLSALAVQRHAVPLLRALAAARCAAEASVLLSATNAIRNAPAVIATQARVALADEVGESLRARIAVSLIGERPGLSSPDSLGVYVTANPRVGCTDAERNCISNIHAAGLSYDEAAAQISELIGATLAGGKTGVALAASVPSIRE